ncbi:MAG: ATP-binding protein [Spirochaetales bacterium]|nr:ATP-binding protein [Spirochaetales bacterium]
MKFIKSLGIPLLLLLSLSQVYGQSSQDSPNIYFICSFNENVQDTQHLLEAEKEEILKVFPRANFFSFYLDLKRVRIKDFSHESYTQMIREKTELFPPDLVITNHLQAFNYVHDIKYDLLGSTPVLAVGIKHQNMNEPPWPPEIGFVQSPLEILETLEAALLLQPETEHIYIIGNERINEKDIGPLPYFSEAIEAISSRVEVHTFTQLPLPELIDILKNANKHSIALIFPVYSDRHNSVGETYDQYRELAQKSPLPIYQLHEIAPDLGFVGGYLASPTVDGHIAGEMAIRTLRGEIPSEIEIDMEDHYKLTLDYKVLKRFHIPRNRVPEGAIILNDPKTIYEDHKPLILTFLLAIILLFTALILLSSLLLVRKKSQKEIRKVQSYLLSIVNTMPSVLIGVDRNGRINLWNNMAADKFKMTQEEALNRFFPDILKEETNDMALIRESIDSQKIQSISFRKTRCKQEFCYENITIYPIISEGSVGAIYRIDDVTAEREMQERLNHKNRINSLGELAAGLAHDFNNTLAGIISATQLLNNKKDRNTPQADQLLDVILSTSRSSAEMIRKLLVFGRKEKVEKAPLDLHQLLEDVVIILNRTLDKSIHTTFVAGAEHTHLTGDKNHLQNAFINLGINASHAMEGGGELTFATRNVIRTEKEGSLISGEYIKITVSDTGCGISPESLDRIFDPFFTTKEAGKGTGLGLTTVFKAIENHQGTVDVDSIVDEGTTFSIMLPCSQYKKE